MHEQRIEAIDHGFFEWIEAHLVARLPSQDLGAGQRIDGHAALAFLVQLREPGPQVGQFMRQLRHGRRVGRAVQGVLPGGIQVVALGITIACRCSAIKQVIGVQQQALDQTFKKLASFSRAAVTRSCQVGSLSNAVAIKALSNATGVPLPVKPYQSTATASARRFWLSSMTWTS